ncbi:5-methyltetrahydropteroyltriglutamate--homocysteine S-methyltransferase [Thermosyntropha sp.]|uniref:5-methyltetrahydropteroyltriglutamate-- homocysteine S-methyltransferase n=1 Tax=Thermosyntropha sp. TaxID=2740820 RepID=UPI0025D583F3|nr:5-methyltetrahydropteroyltriglutamate--homocysteine S-methyltransferase [Thermosyntropha sp.]MBO8157958.1 5-methyltetrahydropteroyltriglutamate--homocysteine S-methyltransferase [Thermosyntropha sp.]
MLRTSVVGFPRIGAKRELKTLVEAYFKGNISREALFSGAQELRRNHWLLQKKEGLDLIPSNDFSFYDTFLDMACMLNVIPLRYKELGLNDIDTYFAMAKGYQDDKRDVKALEMKKWFNTNYHYIVPEIDDSIEFKLNSSKVFEEYQESLAEGIETKPVIIGPFTFLKLSRIKTNKDFNELLLAVLPVYEEILDRFNDLQVKMLQIDEPAIVMDLSSAKVNSFVNIYEKLLARKGRVKVLLQTYFGDIRDIYKEVISLDFDAIGLDFIEGKKTRQLIRQYGFPSDKILFAGIVNGKNIWINNYALSMSVLDDILNFVSRDRLVLSTSCSLLHVPYTVENENKMETYYKENLAFAREKLRELTDLKQLLQADNYQENLIYQANQEIIQRKKISQDFFFTDVQAKISSLSSKDFIRQPSFSERIKKQKEILNLPIFPTTTIGSFPQTAEVRKLRSDYRKGNIGTEQYKNKIREYIREAIKIQEEIGLDVLVHGEYERNDMVEYFAENLRGFLITQNGWVQSYGTRVVKPPIIFRDVKREKAITVEWICYAQSLTNKLVKGILTGPITILNWSFPREDISLEETAFQIALAVKEEVMDLEAAGIKIIQIDEAALREKLPLRKTDWNSEYLDWAIKAFRLVHSSVKAETQIHTHMCYSEFADIIKEIEAMDADVYSFEAARSDLSLLDVLKENRFCREIGLGVYDIHSPRIPKVTEIQNILNKITAKLEVPKIWVNPDCGLKTRGMAETVPSLINLVTAVQKQRQML